MALHFCFTFTQKRLLSTLILYHELNTCLQRESMKQYTMFAVITLKCRQTPTLQRTDPLPVKQQPMQHMPAQQWKVFVHLVQFISVAVPYCDLTFHLSPKGLPTHVS